MHRVFADAKDIDITEKKVKVTDDDAHHLINVLRIKPGEEVIVCDTQKTDYLCAAANISKDFIIFDILDRFSNKAEKNYHITLCQAMPKAGKIELVLQKAVELGADDIIIFYSKRCDAVYEKSKEDKKLARYKKIVYEAAKQCGRGIIPGVQLKEDFCGMYESISKICTKVMAYEEEKNVSIKQILPQISDSAAFIIGPEGGFEACEAQYALSRGAHIVSLGSRILRTETAGMFVLCCLAYEKELNPESI